MAMNEENAIRPPTPSAPDGARFRSSLSRLFGYPVAWTVLVISLVASAGGWFIAREHENLAAQKQFEEEAARIQTVLSERMAVYQDVLRGGVGLFAASYSVERAEWRAFTKTISADQRFPGIDGLGFIASVPRNDLAAFLKITREDKTPDFQLKNAGTNDDFFIVKYMEPEARHRGQLGVDMGNDADRRAVAELARDTGQATISGRLRLRGNRREGLLMLVPVYRNGAPAGTADERRTNIVGWVFARFITAQLMGGIVEKKSAMLRCVIYDRNEQDAEATIFDNAPDADDEKKSGPQFSSVHTLSVGRHHWVLHFTSKPAFDAAISRTTDRLAAIAGGMISLLLFAIALSLSATRDRAQRMATEMTAAFRNANARLETEIAERGHAERRTAAQYAVAKVLAEAGSLTEAAPRLLQAICETLGWDVGELWQVERFENRLRCVELWHRAGLDVAEFKASSQQTFFQRGEGLPGRVWADGRPLWIADVARDENFPRKKFDAKSGLHAALGFPLLVGDKVLGVMEFFSHDIEEPDAELLAMMSAAGSQIGQFMERKRSEKALDRERYLMRTLMDNLPDRIYFKDLKSRFLRNSRAHLQRFGVESQDQLLGKTDFDFFAREHAQQAFDDEQELIQGGQPITKEERETWPDGSVTWALSTKLPLRDESGQTVGTFGISRDITAGKRAEEALRVAKDAAEDASRTKSQFLASMSHELRTPLNSVIGFANILLKNKAGALSASELTFLDRILANGKHLLSLINEILDLSKIEANKMELQIAPTDLGKLVRETVAQQEGLVRERPVQLLADIPDAVAPLPADADKLKQVIINLVGNALKFTERGSVTVRVVTDPQTNLPLRLDVKDTGIGIPQEKLGLIFEAFQQAEAGTARKYGGTGLGLTISQALCRLMGYHITVASEMDEGSTFSVVLAPVPTVAAGVNSFAAAEKNNLSAGRAPSLPGRRVLVIDDELDSRTLLCHLIADCGCEVMAASSGAQGLQVARAFHPDLITLDLMMPNMDGWQVVRAIKSDPQLAHIPVVVVSVVGNENRGHIFGAVDVLQKPVAREDFVAALQRNIRAARPRVLIVDDDADARNILAAYMQDEKEVEIRHAGNGHEALALMENFPPDLILLDLMMPVMDGLAFLDALRDDPRFQRVPVVVITAKTLTPAETERLKLETLRVLNKNGTFDGSLKQLLEELFRNIAPKPLPKKINS